MSGYWILLSLLVTLYDLAWCSDVQYPYSSSDPDEIIDRIGQPPPPAPRASNRENRAALRSDYDSGISTVTFDGGDTIVRSLAIQTNGRQVLAGRYNDGENDVCLSRLLRDGTLDTTFNTTGKIVTTFGNSDDIAHAIKIQTDGNMVVAGRSSKGPDLDFFVLRYTTNGRLDTSFSTLGAVQISVGTGLDIARALEIDTLGRMLLAGYYDSGSRYDSAVMRLLSDGQLDTSFATTGKFPLVLAGSLSSVTDIALHTSGSILLSGGAFGADWTAALARLASNGTLDTSFDADGQLSQSFGTLDDFFYRVRIDTAGRILGVGVTKTGNSPVTALIARYRSNGALDTSFRTVGSTTLTDSAASAVILQGNQILISGTQIPSADTTAREFFTARFRTDGNLDTSWNTTGFAFLSVGADADEVFAIGQWRIGEVIVAGSTTQSGKHFAAARYNNDGALAPSGSVDYSFGSSGIGTVTAGIYRTLGIFVDSSGRILASGYNVANDGHIGRILSDGSLDASFGTAGTARATSAQFRYVRTDPTGRYLMVDGVGNSLFRLNTNGTIDTSLTRIGTSGVLNSLSTIGQFTTDSTGRFLLAGRISLKPIVYRLHTNGTIDTSFSTIGKTVFSTPSLTVAYGQYHDLAMDTGGRILAVGHATTGGSSNGPSFQITRLGTNGSFDTSFYTIGYRFVEIGIEEHQLNGVLLQTDGKIVASGYAMSDWAGYYQFIATRFETNGDVDTSFNGQGWTEAEAPSMSVSGLGRPMVDQKGGYWFPGKSLTSSGSFIFRLESDGRLRTTFGSIGTHTVSSVAGSPTGVMGIVQSPDESIYIGSFSPGGAMRLLP